ncbi:hypothetical protein pb186bvf_010105 [Paramecium bursaria]
MQKIYLLQKRYNITEKLIRLFQSNDNYWLFVDGNFVDFHFQINNSYLINQDSFIDLSNLRLKLVQRNEKKGIQIYNKNDKLEIYSKKNDLFSLYNHVRIYTIQQNFYNYYLLQIRKPGNHNHEIFEVVNIKNQQSYVMIQLEKKDNEFNKNAYAEAANYLENLRILTHKKIQSIIEVFDDDQRFYIISDNFYGQSLLDYLRNYNGSISELQLKIIIKQILAIIIYSHSKDICLNMTLKNIYMRQRNDINDLMLINLCQGYQSSNFYYKLEDYKQLGVLMYWIVAKLYYLKDSISLIKPIFRSLSVDLSSAGFNFLKILMDEKDNSFLYQIINHEWLQETDIFCLVYTDDDIIKIPQVRNNIDYNIFNKLKDFTIIENKGSCLSEKDEERAIVSSIITRYTSFSIQSKL